MKTLFALCIVLATLSSAFGATNENHALVVRSRRDIMENSKKLIEDLVARLQTAAKEAMDAVSEFTSGVIHEAEEVKDRVIEDVENYSHKFTEAVDRVVQRISNTSTIVQQCVDSHRAEASKIFNETLLHTIMCVDERIGHAGELIEQLKALAINATDGASAALEDMKNCTKENTGLLNTGSCLGMIVIQTELKSVNFLTQSTILIGRINLAITTLPTNLQVCVGTKLIQTSIETGKIIIEIASCSGNNFFNNITGGA